MTLLVEQEINTTSTLQTTRPKFQAQQSVLPEAPNLDINALGMSAKRSPLDDRFAAIQQKQFKEPSFKQADQITGRTAEIAAKQTAKNGFEPLFGAKPTARRPQAAKAPVARNLATTPEQLSVAQLLSRPEQSANQAGFTKAPQKAKPKRALLEITEAPAGINLSTGLAKAIAFNAVRKAKELRITSAPQQQLNTKTGTTPKPPYVIEVFDAKGNRIATATPSSEMLDTLSAKPKQQPQPRGKEKGPNSVEFIVKVTATLTVAQGRSLTEEEKFTSGVVPASQFGTELTKVLAKGHQLGETMQKQLSAKARAQMAAGMAAGGR